MSLGYGNCLPRMSARSLGYAQMLAPTAGGMAPYFTTTRGSAGRYYDSAGVLQSATNNTPRYDYNPSTLAYRGLLVEDQRTNICLRSETFDNATWTKTNSTVSADAAAAKDGTTTADKIVDNGTNGQHNASQAITISNATAYAFSVFLKAAELTWAFVSFTDGVTARTMYVNLSTGAVGTTAGSPTRAAVIDVGGGWYRAEIVFTSGGTSATVLVGTATGDTVNSYAGSSQGIYAWGAQLETCTPIGCASSYIATTSASVTRSADNISCTPSSFSMGAVGTFYVNAMSLIQHTSPSAPYTVHVSDGTSANRIHGRATTGAMTLNVTVTDTSVAQASMTTANSITGGAFYKAAWRYGVNDFAHCLNAGTVVTDVAGTVPAGLNTCHLGSDHGGSNQVIQWIKEVRYYATGQSNAALQALTT